MNGLPVVPQSTVFERKGLIQAPATWRRVEWVSDVHLHESDPATVQAFLNYLRLSSADAIFILGDLFEVWVGDDARHERFAAMCIDALRLCGSQRQLFFMAGNRDFLAGDELARDIGWTVLEDPSVLCMQGQRVLMSHGDAGCLDDLEYQSFRKRVRDPQWQQEFLSQPLSDRQAWAQQARATSTLRQGMQKLSADVDRAWAQNHMDSLGADILVHGHTHRPSDDVWRRVLPDWDQEAKPPRGGGLALGPQGFERFCPPPLARVQAP